MFDGLPAATLAGETYGEVAPKFSFEQRDFAAIHAGTLLPRRLPKDEPVAPGWEHWVDIGGNRGQS